MYQPPEMLEKLRETIDFAVENIPYYRGRKEEYCQPITTLSDVSKLPVLSPDVYRSAPASFASGDAWPDAITFSSNTTGSVGRPRWHSRAEVDAFAQYFGGLSDREPTGINLIIHPYDHGPAIAIPDETHTLYVPFISPWHYEYILQLLENGWCHQSGIHRVTSITGFSPALRILTVWLQQRGIDPRCFGIVQLAGYGSIQSQVWRERLQDSWGARYRDTYGLSEVKMGAADECTLCGAYHFHRPIYPEVVDPEHKQAIDQGTGILLLTEIYPFAQLQILLRYCTGDLVEIAEPCMLSNLGLLFRGRARDSASVILPDGSSLHVGVLQVAQICAEFPEVALVQIEWADWATDVGAPRLSMSATENHIKVEVELRYSPQVFPQQSKTVEKNLHAKLTKQITGLGAAVRSGDVQLSVILRGPLEIADPVKL